MASQTLSGLRAARRTQASWHYFRPGLPLFLLIGAVLAALLLAYSERPSVRVDIGTRSDYVYLSGFHAREFSAIAPYQEFAWPTQSNTLILDSGLQPGLRMAVLTLDDFQPSTKFPRRLIAVYANDQRMATLDDRGGARDKFRFLLPDDSSAAGLTLRIESLADRTIDIPAVQARKVVLSGARTYRWSDGNGQMIFPALGHGPLLIDLQAAVFHPDKNPVQAELYANGQRIAALPEYGDTRRLMLLLPEKVTSGGDLLLEVRSAVFNDPRPLGVLLDSVSVAAADLGAGQRGMLPPWSAIGFGMLIVLGCYFILRQLNLPEWWAFALAIFVLGIGTWALINFRAPMGLYLRPLALLILFSLILTPLSERFAGWMLRKLDIPLEPWLLKALVAIFILGFVLKGGGMVFPSMRSIDIQWHMDRVRWILDGNLAAMYKPGAFSESVMPIGEWGQNRPVIPYSPYFHIFSTLFALIPWWSMELSANLFSALLDTSRTFMIAILTLKSGLSSRVTLLAALMYAVTPFTFLLHSWGNVPTTFGMWWTLLCTALIVGLYPRLNQRGPLLLLTLVTLATMLFYTVMAVFYGMFIVLFVLILWMRPSAAERRPLRAVILATALGVLLSVIIYYGLYIPDMIERTLPYMANLATQGSQSVGVERAPFSQYLLSYIPHLDYHIWPGDYLYYGVVIPSIFAIPGFLALRRRAVLWAILAAWYSIAVLFLIVGARMSMVDKQIFYVFPAICICWAIYAERFWERGYWARIMIAAIYVFTFVSAMDLWIIRIIRSPIE